jgi:hypothetical protein
MPPLINGAVPVFEPGQDDRQAGSSLLNRATPLAPPPTAADAADWHAQNAADTWAAVKDPQTWQDAARQYGQGMLLGTAAPGVKAPGLGATMDNPNFARWFGASKAVDEAGNPLVLYHGSGAKRISEFKPQLIGSANDTGFYGRGYYFAADPALARDYVPLSGGAVHETHLSIQHPFIWDLSTPQAQAATIARVKAILPEAEITTTGIRVPDSRGATSKTGAAEWTRALQQAGHDGVFVMSPKNYEAYQSGDWGNVGQEIGEAVAFDPRQIKSATSNRGTFDPNDPRIKYGVGGLTLGGGAAAGAGGQDQQP